MLLTRAFQVSCKVDSDELLELLELTGNVGVGWISFVVEEESVVEEGLSAEEGLVVEVGLSVEEGLVVEEGLSVEEGLVVEEGLSVEEGLVVEEGLSVEEGLVVEEGLSVEEGLVVEEGLSVEEGLVVEEELALKCLFKHPPTPCVGDCLRSRPNMTDIRIHTNCIWNATDTRRRTEMKSSTIMLVLVPGPVCGTHNTQQWYLRSGINVNRIGSTLSFSDARNADCKPHHDEDQVEAVCTDGYTTP